MKPYWIELLSPLNEFSYGSEDFHLENNVWGLVYESVKINIRDLSLGI